MSRIFIRMLALAALAVSSVASAHLNGPVNTPCSGTTTTGTVYSGTQGWSIDPATGNGYWSCCTRGTRCVGRNKPANFGTHLQPLAPDTATAAPTRPIRSRGEPAPTRPERQAQAPREHGY